MDNQPSFVPINPSIVLRNLCRLPQLIFEVTDACNLNCTYCTYSNLYTGHDSRTDKYLPFDTARAVIDYLVDLWQTHNSPQFLRRFSIGFYGGEPLLNIDFVKEVIDYIEHQKIINRTIFYTATTNGVLLDRYIDYLATKNFSLLISLDGNEHAQGFRVDKNGNNSFSNVYNNIKMVQERYPAFFKERVSFNAVLHSKNDVGSIFEFFLSNFSKTPTISSLSGNRVNRQRENLFNDICNNYTQSFYKSNNIEIIENLSFMQSPKLLGFYRQYEQKSGNVFDDYRDLLFDRQETGIFPTGTCLPFAKKMFVTVNGKILPCERISHVYTLGKVIGGKVELDFNYIADSHNRHIFKFINFCQKCIHKKSCPRCIYQYSNLKGPDNICNYYSDKSGGFDLSPLINNPNLLSRIMYELKVVK